jgi:hypothetical protein
VVQLLSSGHLPPCSSRRGRFSLFRPLILGVFLAIAAQVSNSAHSTIPWEYGCYSGCLMVRLA